MWGRGFTAGLSPCVSTTQRISLAVTHIKEMFFEMSSTFWGLCKAIFQAFQFLLFQPLDLWDGSRRPCASPQTLSRKWEKVTSLLCTGHKVPTHVKLLQHCQAVQSHRIPVVFEGMEPAVSCSRQFFSAHPLPGPLSRDQNGLQEAQRLPR